MKAESWSEKRQFTRWVGYLSVIAAVLGGIDLYINTTLLDVAVEIALLANVCIHWRSIFGPRDNPEEEKS